MKQSKILITAFLAVACGMGLSLYYIYYKSPSIRSSVTTAMANELQQYLQNKYGSSWPVTQLTKIEVINNQQVQASYLYSLSLETPWTLEIIDKKLIVRTPSLVASVQPEDSLKKAYLMSKSKEYEIEIKPSTTKVIQDEIQSWINQRFEPKKDYSLEIILR